MSLFGSDSDGDRLLIITSIRDQDLQPLLVSIDDRVGRRRDHLAVHSDRVLKALRVPVLLVEVDNGGRDNLHSERVAGDEGGRLRVERVEGGDTLRGHQV